MNTVITTRWAAMDAALWVNRYRRFTRSVLAYIDSNNWHIIDTGLGEFEPDGPVVIALPAFHPSDPVDRVRESIRLIVSAQIGQNWRHIFRGGGE